ncbi:hypothetical protein [Sporosarcina newyorkensis]|uniref:Uncharacterized protein n=1 Tax=Sporosarcina newyorkensis TaxID=759851 RepID=A0A1T4YP04_9BACL|nr:hypothetical protein [Sporosarcina newyorkensis]SKB03564.1 hypothetical protein SAMN04244570_3211 [Sporosarcina newyorkensis]
MKVDNEELLLDYIAASTNLYGVIPFAKATEIYNEHNEEEISLNIMIAFVNNQAVIEKLEERFVHVNTDAFVAEIIHVFDEKEVVEQAAAGKPYYVPKPEEFLLFTDQSYFQRTPQQEQLKKMMLEDLDDSVDIEEEVEELVLDLQMSGGDFTKELSEFLGRLKLPMEKAERYIPVIIDIANTTRLWENRGHTPNELMQ